MTELLVGLLVAANSADNHETAIYTSSALETAVVEEAQLNPSAPAGTTTPCKFWMYHRAVLPILQSDGVTKSFGDGPTMFRTGVSGAPDAPSAFPAYAAGIPNQNTMLVPKGTGGTTAPKPLIQFGPIYIGGQRQVSVIMSAGWQMEVRLYGHRIATP